VSEQDLSGEMGQYQRPLVLGAKVRLLDEPLGRSRPMNEVTKIAAIALANKIARIAWALMVRGTRYQEPIQQPIPHEIRW
jgi:hypothetical protein